jgi:hypothetical protein
MSWKAQNTRKFQYTDNKDNTKNKAYLYTNKVINNEQLTSSLVLDYDKIIKGGCTYVPNFFCKSNDFEIFNKLKIEIQTSNAELVNWSKHFKYENPDISETFNMIVNKLAEHFNVEVIQTRMNYYKDHNDWKPFHHDKHAYGDGKDKIREDFTMGVSFGSPRTLEFKHDETGSLFSFPQNNGDIFAFDSEVNKVFMHGIPKSKKRCKDRISIIAWGKRK